MKVESLENNQILCLEFPLSQKSLSLVRSPTGKSPPGTIPHGAPHMCNLHKQVLFLALFKANQFWVFFNCFYAAYLKLYFICLIGEGFQESTDANLQNYLLASALCKTLG